MSEQFQWRSSCGSNYQHDKITTLQSIRSSGKRPITSALNTVEHWNIIKCFHNGKHNE